MGHSPGALPAFAVGLACVVGCANGRLEVPDAADPEDAAADRAAHDATFLDAPSDTQPGADAGAPDTQPPDAGCPQGDAGLGGIGVPNGTTATATASYQANTPDLFVDGNPGTYWNAGGYTGSITVAFPKAVTLDGVRFLTVASPQATETYTVYGITGGNPTNIGTATVSVPAGLGLAAPIAVTLGTYDAIRVDVSSQGSWAALAELSLLTPQCP